MGHRDLSNLRCTSCTGKMLSLILLTINGTTIDHKLIYGQIIKHASIGSADGIRYSGYNGV